MANLKIIGSFKGHKKAVSSVCVLRSPNDNELRCFSTAADKTGVLWTCNLSAPKKITEVWRKKGDFLGAVQHTVGSLLIVAERNGTWTFLDSETAEVLNKVDFFSVFSPEGKKGGKGAETFTCTALHPDGEYLAAGTSAGNVVFWQISENDVATVIEGIHEGAVTNLDFSELGYKFATHGKGEDVVKIWDMKDLEQVSHIIQLEKGFGARDLSFDPSGRFLSVSGKFVLLFKAGQWGKYSKIDCHKKASTCTRFGGKA
jgi:WD40 repeat protein